jgi:hypothetical protein
MSTLYFSFLNQINNKKKKRLAVVFCLVWRLEVIIGKRHGHFDLDQAQMAEWVTNNLQCSLVMVYFEHESYSCGPHINDMFCGSLLVMSLCPLFPPQYHPSQSDDHFQPFEINYQILKLQNAREKSGD